MIWQDVAMSACSVVFLLGAPGAAFRAKQSTRVGYTLAILTMVICKGTLGLWGAATVDGFSGGIWFASTVCGVTTSKRPSE